MPKLKDAGEVRITHDHVARTTTLRLELRGHVIKILGTVPGVLTRRKAIEALGIQPKQGYKPTFLQAGR